MKWKKEKATNQSQNGHLMSFRLAKIFDPESSWGKNGPSTVNPIKQAVGCHANTMRDTKTWAMMYMRRVSAELETAGGGPEEEDLIVQGVRFAFMVHQFAGGFDMGTMRAFEELRDKARTCRGQPQRVVLC